MSQSNDNASYRLLSTLDSVVFVEAEAAERCRQAGLDPEICFYAALAVREAALNAVLHGNVFDPARILRVSMRNSGSALSFTIADQGQGFDFSRLPDPLDPRNLEHRSGRGIFLMRFAMDEVHFQRLQTGMEVLLIKHLPFLAERVIEESFLAGRRSLGASH